VPRRRGRSAAALAAAAALALAAPLSAAGIAIGGGDERVAATLPAKPWLAGAAEADGGEPAGG
jgi:hypothetical protein